MALARRRSCLEVYDIAGKNRKFAQYVRDVRPQGCAHCGVISGGGLEPPALALRQSAVAVTFKQTLRHPCFYLIIQPSASRPGAVP